MADFFVYCPLTQPSPAGEGLSKHFIPICHSKNGLYSIGRQAEAILTPPALRIDRSGAEPFLGA